MNIARLSGIFATACLCGAAYAAENSPHAVSANVALTTDYIYRGISQTSEDPAIQGGFDYSYAPFGFYLGIWASSLEFNAGSSDAASIEIDWYGGFAGAFSNGISWDIGGLYYSYPDQDEDDSPAGDYDFVEAYGSLGYSFAEVTFEPSVTGMLAYSPDFYGEDGDGIYLKGTLELSLPHDIGLAFDLAYQDVDGNKTSGPDGFDYTHWRVGLSKEFAGLGLDVSYYDSSDSDDCGGNLCDGRVVFTLSASLDL